MSLEIKKINKKYGDQDALIDVSFSLKKGDIVGFLGPNGAGKTTLMKIITSIIKPDSGDITINGYDTQKNEISTKRQIGYLAENNPLYKDMLVTEYLDFIASLYEIENKKDKVKEIIKKTGLESEIKKKIEELSKGYKQRVGIAAALVHDPNVLILDEPTTGLDPNQLIEIRKLIQEIGQEKIVLLSTHILQEIPKICNHIIIINKGRIVENTRMQNLIKKSNNLEDHFQKLTA
ncbi:ATP-binding cassette domain-containing protein [bacterium]|jgi:ABC-2 type transport system ATP-binding protein|nr:ATP-binding cassette domain-containing protein [bacterium]